MPKVKITLDGETHEFEADSDQTVFEAASNHDLKTPFGCTMGNCHTCLAKHVKGKLDRGENDSLDEEEKAQGLILTCQATLQDDDVEFNFDDT